MFIDRLDILIRLLLFALLAFAPLALGAVEAWSELVVFALVVALAVTGTIATAAKPARRWTDAGPRLLIAAFILLSLFQLALLPESWIRLLSPQTLWEKHGLLVDLPAPANGAARMTLSFYPHAGWHDLRLVLCAAVTFWVSGSVFRSPQRMVQLLAVLAVIGGVVSLIALVQQLADARRVYGWIETAEMTGAALPFVNHNHFAQFMNLSSGAALALLLMAACGSTKRRLALLWLAVFILSTVAMFLSLSRGGMISWLIGLVTSGAILVARGATTRKLGVILLTTALAMSVIGYVGSARIRNRVHTLIGSSSLDGGRMQMLWDIMKICGRFPALGVGLGCHELVFPMYDSGTNTLLATHAENEYAQLAEEMGIAGVALAGAFMWIIWRAYALCVRRREWFIVAPATGLGFGLLAVQIHSFADFGQHVPANALWSAVFCALLLNLARKPEATSGKPLRHIAMPSRLGRAVIASIIASGGAMVLWHLNELRLAESHWHNAIRQEDQLRAANWEGSDGDYAELLSEAGESVALAPDDVSRTYWLNLYRWKSINRVGQPQREHFGRRILLELHQARRLAPTYAPLLALAGQIEMELGQAAAVHHIQMAAQLAPSDPDICFLAARAAILHDDDHAARPFLRRAVTLDGQIVPDVMAFLLLQAHRPSLALHTASGNPEFLWYLSSIAAQPPLGPPLSPDHPDNAAGDAVYAELARRARQQALQCMQVLYNKEDTPAQRLAELGSLYRAEQNWASAAACYRRALARDYSQPQWHQALADILNTAGLPNEAAREASIANLLTTEPRRSQR